MKIENEVPIMSKWHRMEGQWKVSVRTSLTNLSSSKSFLSLASSASLL